MKSAVKDIFYGIKGHMETIHLPKEHFVIEGETLSKTYDELHEKLSPDLLKLHQKFVDALEENYSEEVDFFYVEGFKLGLLIGIECAADKNYLNLLSNEMLFLWLLCRGTKSIHNRRFLA